MTRWSGGSTLWKGQLCVHLSDEKQEPEKSGLGNVLGKGNSQCENQESRVSLEEGGTGSLSAWRNWGRGARRAWRRA